MIAEDENSKEFLNKIVAFEDTEIEEISEIGAIEMDGFDDDLIEEDTDFQIEEISEQQEFEQQEFELEDYNPEEDSETEKLEIVSEETHEFIQIEQIVQPLLFQSRLYKTKTIANVSQKVCIYCKTEFSSYEELSDHLEKEASKRPFRCEVCQFRFKQKAKLTRHLKIHNQQKDFKCHICGKFLIT